MQRKKMLIAVLAIALLVGIVTAAIPWFGQIKVTTTVSQAVLVDGESYADMPITQEATVAGGESFCRPHYLTSQTSVPVTLSFETSSSPASNEIHVTYLKPLGYTFTGTIGAQPVSINVVDGDNQVTWTIDFPIDGATGDGSMAVALIIAFNGVGNGPAFQIHNNDGSTTDFPYGTWLYSPWGPTITDGWYGWWSSSVNTLVDSLDWVSCTGKRYRPDNPTGIFTITIDKSKLCEDFHWALYTAIGSGFIGATYQQATYPETFDWTKPIVSAENYKYTLLMEELPSPLTLAPGERLDFYICYKFDLLIEDGTYDIYTTIKPA